MFDKLPIGILGGVFDPIHYGHLHIADTLLKQLGFQSIRFIPCKQQVLKQVAGASPEQRIIMLQLALRHQAHFLIDTREIERDTPSYSINTLESLRAEFPDTPLCLTLGMDAFATLPHWHRWRELLHVAHLVIINRPGVSLPDTPLLNDFLQDFGTSDPEQLRSNLHGCILLQPIEPLAISSTEIRQRIEKKQPIADLVPKAVWEFIQRNHLYERPLALKNTP